MDILDDMGVSKLSANVFFFLSELLYVEKLSVIYLFFCCCYEPLLKSKGKWIKIYYW